MVMNNNLDFKVTDIEKDTNSIELVMKDMILSGIPNEAKDLLNFSGLNNILYKAQIDNRGNFIKLTNTDELLAKYLTVLLQNAKKWNVTESKINKSFKDNRELYKSRLIKDASDIISTLLYPYSIDFPVKEHTLKIHKDVIDQDTLLSTEYIKFIEKSGNEYTYSVDIGIDSVSFGKVLSLYKEAGGNKDPIDEYFASNPKINYMLTINRSTGWVTYVKKTGAIEVGNKLIHQVTEFYIQ